MVSSANQIGPLERRHQSLLRTVLSEFYSIEGKVDFDVSRISSDKLEDLESLLKDIQKHKHNGSDNNQDHHKGLLTIEYRSDFGLNLAHLEPQPRTRSDGVEFNEKRYQTTVTRLANQFLQFLHKDKNVNLDFSRVVEAPRISFRSKRSMIFEACDPSAAHVPIKFEAIYSFPCQLHSIRPLKPVPFMQVVHLAETNQTNMKRTNLNLVDYETLLFANVRCCPVIDKRLGLKRRHGLEYNESRGRVIKVSLDDDALLSLVGSAINPHNENERVLRQPMKVVAAWLELISEERLMYHVMLEAQGSGVRSRFYAAFLSKSDNSKDTKLMDLVAVDSQRATMY